jgi:hypothetical protein
MKWFKAFGLAVLPSVKAVASTDFLQDTVHIPRLNRDALLMLA